MDVHATRDEFVHLRRRLTELRQALEAHRARLKASSPGSRPTPDLIAEGRRLHAEMRRVRGRFAALRPPRVARVGRPPGRPADADRGGGVA
jgi:hypothetical protein